MEGKIKLRNILVAIFGVLIVIGVVVFGLSRTGQLSGTSGGPFSITIDLPQSQNSDSTKDIVIQAIEEERSSEDDSDAMIEEEDARDDVVKVEKVMIVPSK